MICQFCYTPFSLALRVFETKNCVEKIFPKHEFKFVIVSLSEFSILQFHFSLLKLNSMNRKHQVHNLIILDESGSMQSIKPTIISGFNELVQTIKGIEKKFPEQEHLISFVTFNGLGRKTLLDKMPAAELSEIDEKKYMPDSNTPLFDAIGYSVAKLRADIADMSDCNVLVTILTDGEENASVEYKGESIKKLVEELKKKNWTFTYIGTEHDVESFAANISITNTMMFNKTTRGVKAMFLQENESRLAYSQKIEANESVEEDFYKKKDLLS